MAFRLYLSSVDRFTVPSTLAKSQRPLLRGKGDGGERMVTGRERSVSSTSNVPEVTKNDVTIVSISSFLHLESSDLLVLAQDSLYKLYFGCLLVVSLSLCRCCGGCRSCLFAFSLGTDLSCLDGNGCMFGSKRSMFRRNGHFVNLKIVQ